MKNHTLVLEFIILGFSNNYHVNIILFVLLLDVFLLTLIGNMIIATLSFMDHRLQTPMYFFLRNFALVEMCFTSVIIPQLLHSLLTERKSISLPACFLQLFLVFFLGDSMFCHGAVMSFDRYMAICHPLRYSTIMNGRVCFLLVMSCWVISFIIMFPPAFMTVLVPFCGPNIINHFYCDSSELLQLSCVDTRHPEVMIFVSATVILLGTLTVTIISYGCIISTVMRIQSTTGKKKAFSTCSAHLLVVVILYSSTMIRYIRPAQRGLKDFDKVVSFLYCMVVPLFNPYIYALRNEQIKESLKDVSSRAFFRFLRLL